MTASLQYAAEPFWGQELSTSDDVGYLIRDKRDEGAEERGEDIRSAHVAGPADKLTINSFIQFIQFITN